MKITGIICEYNPMHNGHIYHIKRTRENGATHIIAVMSGNFVQRGETAVMSKHFRASLALGGGADLVVEIPVVYSLASAEFYAGGAVGILDSLGCCDELSFGSECGDIDMLKKAADAVNKLPIDDIAEKMKLGMPYPAAAAELIREIYGSKLYDIIASPNNILAAEYIKALGKSNSDIKPFTVKRSGAAHDSDNISNNTASASYIRKCMSENMDFIKLVPHHVYNGYKKCRIDGKLSDMKNLERIILYKLRTSSADDLKKIPDVGQGLEHRLKQASDSHTVNELLERVKNKRYTMARLKRILLNMLIGTTADDQRTPPPYAHILAMNERGCEILAKCRNSGIPVFTSLSKLSEQIGQAKRIAHLEGMASDIYGLSQNIAGSKNDDFRASVRVEKNEN
ncbi:MAG: nucleotidyltransferase family protein [Clostridium sp.]|nr:nucleotidyltransferase family protein [Clostridium sp.]MCM1546836.1 nucleotidyltransferase family protein [Ruminococcus sp.]